MQIVRRGKTGARARGLVAYTDDTFARFSNQVASIGMGKARPALARAVNRTVDTVHGRVARATAKQTSLTIGYVRKNIHKHHAVVKGEGEIEGSVSAYGSPLPMSMFHPHQFRFGVKARAWGKTQRYPGAFILGGNWKSGRPIAGQNAFTNTHGFNSRSKRYNAIEKMFGPSIPEEMVKDNARDEFYRATAEVLPRRIEHELSRLLPH